MVFGEDHVSGKFVIQHTDQLLTWAQFRSRVANQELGYFFGPSTSLSGELHEPPSTPEVRGLYLLLRGRRFSGLRAMGPPQKNGCLSHFPPPSVALSFSGKPPVDQLLMKGKLQGPLKRSGLFEKHVMRKTHPSLWDAVLVSGRSRQDPRAYVREGAGPRRFKKMFPMAETSHPKVFGVTPFRPHFGCVFLFTLLF